METSDENRNAAADVYTQAMSVINPIIDELEFLSVESEGIYSIMKIMNNKITEKNLDDALFWKWSEQAARYASQHIAICRIIEEKNKQILGYQNVLLDNLQKLGIETDAPGKDQSIEGLINLKNEIVH